MEKIAIVGGGLVGSLMSIYLAQKGYDVDVYERRSQGLTGGGRSINLALSNRGWAALKEVGIAEEIKELAIPMEGRMIHHADGTKAFQPYGKEGEAIYSVSRGELNVRLDNLARSHKNVDYYYDVKCSKADLRNHVLEFQNTTTKETFEKNPDIVFGTDGAFSTIRWAMQRKKRFNYQQDFLEHGYKELSIPPAKDGGWLIEKNALHIWPRRSFMLIALPNLDGSFTCTLFMAFEGKEDAFEQLQTPEQVEKFFKTEFPNAYEIMPSLQEDFFSNPTDSLVTIRCFPWTNQDRYILMGDASHAIVPFYGQGMNSGFEDCQVFNQILEQNLTNNQPNWADICQQFEDSRKPDAEAIADLALKNFIEMRNSVADDLFLLRKKIEKHIQKKYPKEFTPAYSLVTFREDIRYSEALRRAKIQDQLFSKLMETPNIQQLWESGELEVILDEMVGEYLELVS